MIKSMKKNKAMKKTVLVTQTKLNVASDRFNVMHAPLISIQPLDVEESFLSDQAYTQRLPVTDFTLEDFNFSFGTNNEVYYYLESICTVKNKDKKVIDDSLNDENISIDMKKRIEKCVFKNYINTGDRMIHKDRPSLVKYAASIFAKDKIKYDDFVDKYHLWLNDYGIYDDNSLRSIAGLCRFSARCSCL